MKEDEFTKLFKYMEARFDKIEKSLEDTATKRQADQLANSVDGLAKQLLEYHQEFIMLGNKVDRLEQWILKVAEATGVKLTV